MHEKGGKGRLICRMRLLERAADASGGGAWEKGALPPTPKANGGIRPENGGIRPEKGLTLLENCDSIQLARLSPERARPISSVGRALDF